MTAVRGSGLPELVTVNEAAAALHCTRQTIYNLMNRGQLPSVKIAGMRRIPAEAVRSLAGDDRR